MTMKYLISTNPGRLSAKAGSRNVSLAMAFKLLNQAGTRWYRVNSPHLVALVVAGIKFTDSKTHILPNSPEEERSLNGPVITC
jgi:hypothetical protein